MNSTARAPVQIDDGRVLEALLDKDLRAVDIVLRESRIRRTPFEGNGPAVIVDDVPALAIAHQDHPHIAQIMYQAGDDQVRVILRLEAFREDPAVEDVPADERDQKRVLDIVVEGIALPEALQREPRGLAKTLGLAQAG